MPVYLSTFADLCYNEPPGPIRPLTLVPPDYAIGLWPWHEAAPFRLWIPPPDWIGPRGLLQSQRMAYYLMCRGSLEGMRRLNTLAEIEGACLTTDDEEILAVVRLLLEMRGLGGDGAKGRMGTI